jgi:RHS repeat-associated protein
MKTFLPTPNPTPISPKPVTTIIPSATIILGSGSKIVSVYYGKKRYELSDWLGNVRVVVSDKKIPDNVSGAMVLNYKPEVLSVRDYYSFGSEINERTFEPIKPKYRYGFNTQERVFEINKDHYTARYWEYDSRLGRRWNVDPKPTVGFSVYACLMNNPILWNDIFGDVVGGDEKGMKIYKLYRKEVNSRISYIEKEMEKYDKGSEKYNKLEKQLAAYKNINIELDKLEADKENLYYISGDVKFNDKNVGGMTYYGGKTKYEGQEMKQINIDIASTNFPLGPLAHELKHAFQYYEGRLVFVGGTKGGYDTEEFEKEAFERENRFSGNTLYNNNKFKVFYNIDVNKIILPKHYYENLSEKELRVFKTKGLNYTQIIYNPNFKDKENVYNVPNNEK